MIRVSCDKIPRETCGFFSEQDMTAVRIGNIRVFVQPFRRGKAHFDAAVLRQIVFKRIIMPDVQQIPVIQSGAFQFFVIDLETHRADQVQAAARNRAGACDIAGILRDFRFDKNDVQHSNSSFCGMHRRFRLIFGF